MSSRIAALDISPVRDSAISATLGSHVMEEITVDHTNITSHSNSSTERTNEQASLFPFTLYFLNLSYSVDIRPNWRNLAGPRSKKVLLNNISGNAKEGEILALLGPSGSGKSTLLDALANRISKGSFKGNVNLNGEKLDSSLLKFMSAYVMQDDMLYPMLTVEETLMFAAKLRLPRTLSDSEKKKRVKALIEKLGLTDAAKTIIGDEGHRGVSGGERRRVSIGIGIIHDPILLFLDEPTTGLDSTSAYMVVRVLKQIAQGGSVVVMSIHQPSYRILGLIDQLLVLSRGQTVYKGTLANLSSFMEDFGVQVPDEANPIEYTLDIVRELEGSPKGTLEMVDFNKHRMCLRDTNVTLTCESSLNESLTTRLSQGKLVRPVGEATTTSMISSFANPFWTEVAVLVKRSFINSRRSQKQLQGRLGVVILGGIILATLFRQLDHSPKGIKERVSFFAFTLCTAYFSCAEVIPIFFHERHIFIRETTYNTYRRSSYVISHTLAIIPYLLLQSLLFTTITFWSVGLEGGISGFLFYILVIFASFWAGTSFVTFISGIVPHIHLCYVGVIATMSYFLLACGFYISRLRIQPYWKWLHYISVLKYSYESLMLNEFQDSNRCYVRGVQVFDSTIFSEFTVDFKEKLLMKMGGILGVKLTRKTCLITSEDLLNNLAITELSKWNCVWVILAWGFCFKILFYLSLLLGSKNKRS